ncbi:bis(5'-nucleosyl)-tetraphosphatase (symmetrical) YqeK [Meiothermus ruber]|uniref:bis(5'-nucleosyl)-tetraphosphatase (symmetrical) n=1 Tax=Meiothermus ruber (strain ATCC 35948 / DSM 1279 / VKM B-1258 / 21) TaxID=504728 RepID=A0A806CS27_MEIRD|nr:bis(5'-nucleosyl)-tetraphosphatase (symmetrical) YqeK [Meiothermus ruber]ADD28982.1 metal dependent phosphohydrolase [Meiothermus ruber DSM 1279]MCL6528685.1 bis(5'-nucleosyl)-tetraphosphatase (symmetrical) YqeK [Meiothermus ruber]
MIRTSAVADYAEKVRRLVKPERYEHILRVAELAAQIARANRLDEGKTYLAAILHDAARDLSAERLLELATPENEIERNHPLALHGRAGRRLAEAWGIEDEEVLEAIEGHVYGVRPDHGIGMALYIADVSEPGRGVNHEIREMALSGRLEEAYQKAVVCKVDYLQKKGITPHPRTWAAYQALQRKPGDR